VSWIKSSRLPSMRTIRGVVMCYLFKLPVGSIAAIIYGINTV
jgi:hypothetical protein